MRKPRRKSHPNSPKPRADIFIRVSFYNMKNTKARRSFRKLAHLLRNNIILIMILILKTNANNHCACVAFLCL